MPMKMTVPLVMLVVWNTYTVTNADAVQWRIEDGGNGHWYTAISLDIGPGDSGGTHYQYLEAARVIGGDLASVTSAEEDTWLRSNVASDESLWRDNGNGCTCVGPMIGAFRDAEGNWTWTDDSEWGYEAWHPGNPGEPSDLAACAIYWERFGTFLWQDSVAAAGSLGFPSAIVEWSADCNDDGIVDYGQILDGTLTDSDGDFVPDNCENGEPANLVVNGSFEDGYPGPSPGNDCVRSLSGGSSVIPGWIVTGGSFSIDWVDGGTCDSPVTDGRYKLDLQGSLCSSCNNNGGVIQTVELPGPGSYVLQLDISTNSDPNESAVISIDGIEYEIIGEETETEWNTYSIPFQAQNGSVEVHVFSPQSNTGASTPALDNVVLAADCNGDGIIDYGQILDGTFEDTDGNGVPDCCDSGASCASCSENHVLRLNAWPDAAVIPHHQSIAPSEAMTIEFWIQVEGSNGDGRPITKRPGNSGCYTIDANRYGSTCVGTNSVFGSCNGTPWGEFSPEWTHLALTVDGSTGMATSYVDGVVVSVNDQEGTCSIAQGSWDLRFGNTPGYSTTQFIGCLDNIRVWNRALSRDEVRFWMHNDITTADAAMLPELGGSWNFEGGVQDATGLNHGWLEGSARIESQERPKPQECLGDLDGDGNVDGTDLARLLAFWGSTSDDLPEADLNDDGAVDGEDLTMLLGNWGIDCT